MFREGAKNIPKGGCPDFLNFPHNGGTTLFHLVREGGKTISASYFISRGDISLIFLQIYIHFMVIILKINYVALCNFNTNMYSIIIYLYLSIFMNFSRRGIDALKWGDPLTVEGRAILHPSPLSVFSAPSLMEIFKKL